MSKPLTIKECFAEITPVLDEVSRLVHTAPISDKEHAGLAILIANYFMGLAAGFYKDGAPGGFVELAALMLDCSKGESRIHEVKKS